MGYLGGIVYALKNSLDLLIFIHEFFETISRGFYSLFSRTQVLRIPHNKIADSAPFPPPHTQFLLEALSSKSDRCHKLSLFGKDPALALFKVMTQWFLRWCWLRCFVERETGRWTKPSSLEVICWGGSGDQNNAWGHCWVSHRHSVMDYLALNRYLAKPFQTLSSLWWSLRLRGRV